MTIYAPRRFRQTYAHEWPVPLESAKTGGGIAFDKEDMSSGMPITSGCPRSLKNFPKSRIHGKHSLNTLPGSLRQRKAAQLYLKETSVPTMVVGAGGPEDLSAAGDLSCLEERTATTGVSGHGPVEPWRLGGRGRRLGAIDFGSDTGRHFKEKIQHRGSLIT